MDKSVNNNEKKLQKMYEKKRKIKMKQKQKKLIQIN